MESSTEAPDTFVVGLGMLGWAPYLVVASSI